MVSPHVPQLLAALQPESKFLWFKFNRVAGCFLCIVWVLEWEECLIDGCGLFFCMFLGLLIAVLLPLEAGNFPKDEADQVCCLFLTDFSEVLVINKF
jgi:hypothetical protein